MKTTRTNFRCEISERICNDRRGPENGKRHLSITMVFSAFAMQSASSERCPTYQMANQYRDADVCKMSFSEAKRHEAVILELRMEMFGEEGSSGFKVGEFTRCRSTAKRHLRELGISMLAF